MLRTIVSNKKSVEALCIMLKAIGLSPTCTDNFFGYHFPDSKLKSSNILSVKKLDHIRDFTTASRSIIFFKVFVSIVSKKLIVALT